MSARSVCKVLLLIAFIWVSYLVTEMIISQP